MRRARRTDANHGEIISAMRAAGAYVIDTSSLAKFVDAVVGYRGKTALVEIKDGNKPPSARKLTPDQRELHASWTGGTLAVVSDVESALRLLKVMEA